jgi:hypothetical protein
VLDWLADQDLRAVVGRQLNKGEQAGLAPASRIRPHARCAAYLTSVPLQQQRRQRRVGAARGHDSV